MSEDAERLPAWRSALVLTVIFVLLGVGLVTAGVFYHRSYSRRTRSGIEQELLSLADLKAEGIRYWKDERIGDSAVLFENTLFAELTWRFLADPENDFLRDRLRRYLEKIRTSYRYRALALFDREGRRKLSVPDEPARTWARVLSILPDLISNPRVVFLDFHRDRPQGLVHSAMAVPVYDPAVDAKPFGVLALRIDPMVYLYGQLREVPETLAGTRNVLVVPEEDDPGRYREVSFADGAVEVTSCPLAPDSNPAVQAIRGKRGIVEGNDRWGHPVLAVVRPVENSPWILISSIPLADIEAAVAANLREVVLAVFLLLLAAAAGLGLFWRRQSLEWYRRRYLDMEEKKARAEEFQYLLKSMTNAFAVFRSVFAGDGTFVSCRFEYINTAGGKMTGVCLKDVVGKDLLEVWPDTEDYWIKVFAAAAVTGIPRTFEFFHGSTGKLFAGTAYRPWPERERFCVIFEDVTEPRRMVAALRESEELFRSLAEASADFIVRYDRGCRYIYLNPAVLRALGRSPEKLIGAPLEEAGWGEALSGVLEEKVGEVLSAGAELKIQLDWTGPTGIRVLDWRLTPERGEGGGVASVLAVARDISDLRRAEQERLELERRLVHAQKLESLGVLASGIAHDFNNLLMAILGNLELALESVVDREARESVEDALRAARRGSDLTRQILAYTGKGGFRIEKLDLSAQVSEIAAMLRSSISRRTVFELDLADNLPLISADPGQIQQVVMNLITNASEAIGDRSGKVTVSTSRAECSAEFLRTSRLPEVPAPGLFVRFSVADNGCGMNAETLHRLFDPFFSTKFTGRGLGLSALLGIVRSHGGAVMVRSRLGEGTTIEVFFPAEEVSGKTVAVREVDVERDRSSPALPSGTVLVVDDESLVRKALCGLLSRLGFAVLAAASGTEAVEIFSGRGSKIAAVLLDLTMPGMDGIATWKELRRIDPSVRVILISGYSEPESVRRLDVQERVMFLQKPVNLDELKRSLKRLFGPVPPAS